MKHDSVEEVIRAYLPAEQSYADRLMEAMNYSVQVGGKRVRPTMMLEAYRLFGGSGEVIEPFMAAIEMIHSYSLVHDDLPAIDNDELRRGNLTTWKKFGESTGILAGDGLLTYAFETAARAFEVAHEESALIGRAMSVLANKAGLYGMCGGEYVDVEVTGVPVDESQLMYIYRLKTGALLECAMMIGAILAGASEADTDKMRQAGLNMGLAFQIRDDILDVTSSAAELGKPIGSDEKNGKITYVTLHGLTAAQAEVHRLSDEAADLINTIDGDKTFFLNFIKKLETRNK